MFDVKIGTDTLTLAIREGGDVFSFWVSVDNAILISLKFSSCKHMQQNSRLNTLRLQNLHYTQ